MFRSLPAGGGFGMTMGERLGQDGLRERRHSLGNGFLRFGRNDRMETLTGGWVGGGMW